MILIYFLFPWCGSKFTNQNVVPLPLFFHIFQAEVNVAHDLLTLLFAHLTFFSFSLPAHTKRTALEGFQSRAFLDIQQLFPVSPFRRAPLRATRRDENIRRGNISCFVLCHFQSRG